MSDSIDNVLTERGKTHGNFRENALRYYRLKKAFYDGQGSGRLPPEFHMSVDLILLKLSRIAVGDPTHIDHYFDIEGYAKGVRAMIEEQDATAE